ncbi:MAG TPA: hypothetical protein VNV87_00030 [Acidimicrobiales bacterium]|jgi:hypothetical protein|nr:hypothetical protein [Acidimicrobiales bacterium]
MAEAVNGGSGHASITYAEIHSELEEVRRILIDLTGTVERLSRIVASVSPQHVAPPPSPARSPEPPAPEILRSPPPVAPNPVDAILGDTFGRPT